MRLLSCCDNVQGPALRTVITAQTANGGKRFQHRAPVYDSSKVPISCDELADDVHTPVACSSTSLAGSR